jgi:hypothetical protein
LSLDDLDQLASEPEPEPPSPVGESGHAERSVSARHDLLELEIMVLARRRHIQPDIGCEPEVVVSVEE